MPFCSRTSLPLLLHKGLSGYHRIHVWQACILVCSLCALCLGAPLSAAESVAEKPDTPSPLFDDATLPDEVEEARSFSFVGDLDMCDGPPRPMTLEECVALAMRRNVNIEIAYLERVLQKFDLVTTAYYTFAPRVSLDGRLQRRGSESRQHVHEDDTLAGTATFTETSNRTTTDSYGVTPSIEGLVPTGARYAMSWRLEKEHTLQDDRTLGTNNATGWERTSRRGMESELRFSISQPLLKGAGLDYSLATVRLGVLDEKINVLNLKSSIINELTTAIRAYRALLAAQWSVAISRNSLQRAMENLELAQAKIQTGRMAAMDILQFEADSANRELSLERSRDAYNTARLDLLQLLDMDRSLCIEPAETLEFDPMDLDLDRLQGMVFESRPEYLTNLLQIRKNELALLQTQRDRLWDLSLDGEGVVSEPWDYVDKSGKNTRTTNQDVSWSLGLNLNIPIFGNEVRNLQRSVLQAKSTLHTSRIRLRKQEQDILSNLEQQLDNIGLLHRQVTISHKARILADRKLEVERIKLQKGRSSTFQLVTFQDQQFQAREAELAAKISYLNALTELDQFLGTTLDSWDIEFKSYRKADANTIDAVKMDAPAPALFNWGVELTP